MNVYLDLKNVPELSQLPREERRRRWRRVYPKTFRHWETWAGFLVLFVSVGLGSQIGASYGHTFIGSLVGCIVGANVLRVTAINVARRYHREALLSDERS